MTDFVVAGFSQQQEPVKDNHLNRSTSFKPNESK